MTRDEVLLEKARQIKLLILDVDGVLTDGRLFFDMAGNEYKSFHAQDGHGIKLLRQNGVDVAVISGRNSAVVTLRMNKLGVEHVYQGYENKIPAFDALLEKLALCAEQVAYVGDDLLDLPLMRRVGLAVTVNDCVFGLRQYADWCTSRNGGQGAVREVCDFLLIAQGRFDAIVAAYS